ncbi:MAG TPA: LysR family transcriptional regulator [Selenomonadales bacterium]|nr:LysR family transcriptional regulator [Selenomonadales bacterium]
MELRQLEYFQFAARLSSITKAAARLHVAQPSVTVAIHRLEEELGVTLFDRSQKQISLTAEGRAFAVRAEDILNRVRDAVAEMNDYRLLQKGSIKIGIPPMIGAFLFPHIIARFQKAYPHFELLVAEEGSLSIRKQIELGELDVGIIITDNLPTRLSTAPLTDGQLMVCLPHYHPLGAYSAIPFTLLRGQPFILFNEDAYSRQLIMTECQRNEFTPDIVFSFSQIETILGLVEQGVGISFLLDEVSRRHPRIQSRPLSDPLRLQIGLVWNSDKYLSKAARAFISFCTEAFPVLE